MSEEQWLYAFLSNPLVAALVFLACVGYGIAWGIYYEKERRKGYEYLLAAKREFSDR